MRLPDWEARLAAVVDEAQRRPFAWGHFDCCTFASDAAQAVSGVDRMGGLRRRYRDMRSALRLVRDLGGLMNAVKQALGEPLATPKLAQRGDIVLVRAKLPALGVVVGQSALVPLVFGVQRVAMGDWIAGWRVE